MKAMLFAAGIGSRLGAITASTPKSLVEVNGKPMLEHVILRLKEAGVTGIMINIFHLSDLVQNFIKEKNSFSLDIQFSKEERLLDTGGGLKKVSAYFENEEYFYIYNCDIYCELDLRKLEAFHRSSPAVATLVTMKRESKRGLFFDSSGCLTGWNEESPGEKFGFSGIHLATPELFTYMESEGDTFSIIQAYMNAVKAGKRVQNYNLENEYWIDMGKPESLEHLRKKFSDKK